MKIQRQKYERLILYTQGRHAHCQHLITFLSYCCNFIHDGAYRTPKSATKSMSGGKGSMTYVMWLRNHSTREKISYSLSSTVFESILMHCSLRIRQSWITYLMRRFVVILFIHLFHWLSCLGKISRTFMRYFPLNIIKKDFRF